MNQTASGNEPHSVVAIPDFGPATMDGMDVCHSVRVLCKFMCLEIILLPSLLEVNDDCCWPPPLCVGALCTCSLTNDNLALH